MNFCEWHFQREMLAESYFKTIFSGVMLSTTIFAERKTGLTSFLINDLMPCAVKNDHNVVYVDLSNKNVPVTAAVLMAIDRVLMAGNSSNVSFDFLKGIFFLDKKNKKNDVKSYINKENSVDVEFFSKNINSHLELINEKISLLIKKKKSLFIFDNVEGFLSGDISENFLDFLKGVLISNREKLKTIYATSDMDRWKLIFKDPKSPLYSEGASIHNLPYLNKPFIRYILNKNNISSEFLIDSMFNCFLLTGKNPGIFMGILSGWIQRKSSVVGLSDYFEKELMLISNAASKELVTTEDARSFTVNN